MLNGTKQCWVVAFFCLIPCRSSSGGKRWAEAVAASTAFNEIPRLPPAEQTRWHLKHHIQDKNDFSKLKFQPASPRCHHPRTAARESEGFLIIWVFQWEPASCVCWDLQSSCRVEGTEWKERAVSLFSPLFNLHVHMPDAPDSTRPWNNFPAGRRHADCTIFSHPEFRRRPMQPSTVICHPSVPPSHFYIFPPTSRSVSVKFPLASSISVLARTPASHCTPSLSRPSLCLCLFTSPSFFWLNLFFARLSSFFLVS